jgi:hypothetical protein
MTNSIPRHERLTISRRNALRFGALSLPLLTSLPMAGTASAVTTRPSGAGYVRYEDLYRSGDSLQAVVNKVTGNRVLTLPAGTFLLSNFRNGEHEGVRIGTDSASGCRGIAGSGRDTIIRMRANVGTNLGNNFAGNQMVISSKSGALLTNFSLRGNPQNGLLHAGIVVSNSPNAEVSNLYLRGASRGTSQSPPGETFGINVMRSDGVTIKDCEVDGRDDAGMRVAASPIGFNFASNVKVLRTYVHHGVASMLTFYKTNNIYTEDFSAFSTSSGPGGQSGHGINHEQSAGTIRHVRPRLFVNGVYSKVAGSTGSTGLHMALANTETDVTSFTVVEPTFDLGPSRTGMFCIQISDGYTVAGVRNKVRTSPRIIRNGVTLSRSDHPHAGWGDKDPMRHFAIIH